MFCETANRQEAEVFQTSEDLDGAMMGLWQAIPELRQRVDALALKFGKFETHMEKCEEIRELEAELAKTRHSENKDHLDRQDKRIEIINSDLVTRAEDIRGDLRKIIWGSLTVAGAIIGFLALLVSHLVKLAG